MSITIYYLEDRASVEIIYTREKESQIAGSPRHEDGDQSGPGADKNGKIRAIDIYTLSNSGAYGEHGPTTVGLSDINQSRCIPAHWKRTVSIMMLYIRIFRRRVHTGVMGQRREFCAGICSEMNWQKNPHMDPTVLRDREHGKEGMFMPVLFWRDGECLCIGSLYGPLQTDF